MSVNAYYIVGGIAAVVVVFLTIFRVRATKRKKRQLAEFEMMHSKRPSNQLLGAEQCRLLTYGAIWFRHRREEIWSITPQDGVDTYINELQENWVVSSRREALSMMGVLIELQCSRQLDELLIWPTAQTSEIRAEIAKGLKVSFEEVQKTTSTYAWDICRAVVLTKWGYWCGYLSEDECWEIMRDAANKAGEVGNDWTDYTVSFLLGGAMQGLDLDDVIIEARQILRGKGPWLGRGKGIDAYFRYAFK